MAYGVKYTDTCTLQGGDTLTINIYKESYASGTTAIQPAPNGLRIEWGEQSDDILAPIRRSQARLVLIADATDSFMSDLETAYDTEFLLEITRGSTTLFYGVVDPYRGGRRQKDNSEVVIYATDGFDFLQNIGWSAGAISGRSTVLQVIDDCLDNLPYGSTWGFKTDNVCKPDGVTTGDVLTQVYIDESRYQQYTQDGELYEWRAYDVLHDIMTRFGLSLCQWNGSWYIQQVPQYQTGTYAEYTYNSTPALTATDATHSNLWTFTSGTNAYMVDEYPIVRRARGYGQINVLYNHDTTWELIKNGSFTEPDPSVSDWARYWTRQEDSVVDGDEIYLNTGFNVPIPKVEPPSNQHAYMLAYFDATPAGATPGGTVNYIEQQSVSLTSGTELTLKFSALLDLANATPYSTAQRRFWWRLTDGTNYWDEANNTWTTSTYNSISIYPNGQQIDYEYKLAALPATAQYTLRIYTVHDELVDDDTGGAPNAYDPADWNAAGQASGTTPDIAALRIDGIWLEDGLAHPVGLRTWTYEGTDSRYKMHDPVTVYIGDGPETFSQARLTTDSGGTTQTTNWDGLGFTDLSFDQWLGSVYLKYKGKPRLVKELNFKELDDTDIMAPVEVMVLDSVRYWPTYFYLDPIGIRFGGVFTELNTQTNTLSSATYESGSSYTRNGAVTSGGAPSAVTVNVTNNTGLLNVDDLSVIAPSTGSLTIDGSLTVSGGSITAGGGDVVIDDDGVTLSVPATIGAAADKNKIKFGTSGEVFATYDNTFLDHDFYVNSPGALHLEGENTGTDQSYSVFIDGHTSPVYLKGSSFVFDLTGSILVGSATLTDSDSSTGSSGQVLSQDAGGLVWADAAVGYATSSGKGNDGKVYLAVDVTTDNTWVSVPDTSAAALGTHFDDNVDVTYLTGRVTIWSESSAQKSIWNVDAVVVTSIAGVQSILDQNVTEHYATSTGSHSVQFAIVSNKVNLQAKDTSNVANLSNITTATIEWTSARSPTYAT